MGVVPKDSMSINLTQCQLPREAHRKSRGESLPEAAWHQERSPGLQPESPEPLCSPFLSGFDRLALRAAEANPALAQMPRVAVKTNH